MTTWTDRVPVERITGRARDVRPGRAALTVIAAVLFAVGWVAFKTLAVAWLVVVWCGSAVIEGWSSARSGQRAP